MDGNLNHYPVIFLNKIIQATVVYFRVNSPIISHLDMMSRVNLISKREICPVSENLFVTISRKGNFLYPLFNLYLGLGTWKSLSILFILTATSNMYR